MLFMLLAIFFSAALTLLFKLFGKWRVNTFHAIVINYFTAVCCGILASGQLPFSFEPGSPKFGLALTIGSIFILGFNVLARTVQVYGVTIGTLMQKMSVLLTIIYALVWFAEPLGWMKSAGILLALISIGLVTIKDSGKVPLKTAYFLRPAIILPLATFLTSGLIDSLFLTAQKYSWVTGTDIPFISSLFFTAGSIGLMLWILVPGWRKWPGARTIAAGVLLGIPNFFSIYFLLHILDLGWDGSVVFPIFNVGVLLASALIGWLLLKEEMPLRRLGGVLLAAFSIYLISTAI